MSDPFTSNNSEQQLVREAQIGLTLVFLVVASAGGWTYFQYQKHKSAIPLHVQNAPVATHVGPDVYLSKLEARNERTTNSALANSNPWRPSLQQRSVQPVIREQVTDRQIERSEIADVKIPEKIATPKIANARTSFGQSKIGLRAKTPGKQFTPPSKSENQFSPASKDISSDLVKSEPKQTNKNPLSFLPLFNQKSAAERSASRNNFAPVKPAAKQNPAATEPVNQKSVQGVISATYIEENEASSEAENENGFVARPMVPNQPKVGLRPVDLDPVDETPHNLLPTITETVQKLHRSASAEAVDRTDSREADRFVRADADSFVADDANSYQVKKGDSFFTIAQLKYGDGKYFQALYEYNRSSVDSFDEIAEGAILQTPAAAILRAQFPEYFPKQDESDQSLYLTKKGDTLFDIARRMTGQASRYIEIIQLNERELPGNVNHLTRLPANIRLQLPAVKNFRYY